MHFSIDRTVHTTAFDKPVVDHWLEQKIVMYQVSTVTYQVSTNRSSEHCNIELTNILGEHCNIDEH